jgi:hypothetical protein
MAKKKYRPIEIDYEDNDHFIERFHQRTGFFQGPPSRANPILIQVIEANSKKLLGAIPWNSNRVAYYTELGLIIGTPIRNNKVRAITFYDWNSMSKLRKSVLNSVRYPIFH